MDTRALDCNTHNIKEAAKLILDGELVVFPTETVYGLGANAFDPEAVKKIFEAKGRPQDNPLIVHLACASQVGEVAKDVPDAFYELADKFMPGPLTVILPKGDRIPYVVTAGGNTVGVRIPDNEFARQLISLSAPLAAPSANRSKHISPTTAQHVYEDLGGKVPVILDGGACRVGIESTVLDLTSDVPTILRPGAITAETLAQIVGEVSENGKIIKVAKAPGMKYQHYAPVCEAVTASSPHSAFEAYDRAKETGLAPVILARNAYLENAVDRESISLGDTAEDYAKNIYAALHDAEKKYNYIILEEMPEGGIAASVMNRVFKAAGGKRV